MVIDSMDNEIINCINIFTEGINIYIEKAGKRLPPEFRIPGYKTEKWKVEHTDNIIGYVGRDLPGGIFMYRLIKYLGVEAALYTLVIRPNESK